MFEIISSHLLFISSHVEDLNTIWFRFRLPNFR